MPTKKNAKSMKALEDELASSDPDLVRDPALELSIERESTYSLPDRPLPELPNFGFFDTASECMAKIGPGIFFMQDLFYLNQWTSNQHKMKRFRIFTSWNNKTTACKNISLLSEIVHRIGRDSALALYGQLDDLCRAVLSEGSDRQMYADYFNVQLPLLPPPSSVGSSTPSNSVTWSVPPEED